MGSSRGSYGCRESGPLLMTGHSIGGPYHHLRQRRFRINTSVSKPRSESHSKLLCWRRKHRLRGSCRGRVSCGLAWLSLLALRPTRPQSIEDFERFCVQIAPPSSIGNGRHPGDIRRRRAFRRLGARPTAVLTQMVRPRVTVAMPGRTRLSRLSMGSKRPRSGSGSANWTWSVIDSLGDPF
jgi:hypothetical protein